MKTFYLVRHGQTESNLANITGSPDDGLSELGLRQVRLVASRLKEVGAQGIVSSPYRRTVQTAEAIASELGIQDIVHSALLVESTSPSILIHTKRDGEETAELRRQLRAHWGDKTWRHSDEENFYDLYGRAQKALEFLTSRPEDCLIVTSHGAFMRMLAFSVMTGDLLTPEISTQMYRGLSISNTGVTVLTWDGAWRVIRWNDTVHLGPADSSW